MNSLFLIARSPRLLLLPTKIKMAHCLMAILNVAFFLTVLGGCSSDSKEKSDGNSGDDTDELVNYENIVEQVNMSLKFQKEEVAKFDEASMEQNKEFLRNRAKQEQLAMHLRTSAEKVREHIEFVKNAESFSDRFTILTVDERLEVAKLAEAVLAKSDESLLTEAIDSATEKQKKIEEERELQSSSRYEEKKEMKATANLDHPEYQAAFKPLVKEQGTQELGFTLDEVMGLFSESMVNFVYKNDDGKLLRLGISVRPEPTSYVNQDKIKKKEHYLVLADSKTQLVLETGRLFIVLKTDAELEEGDLWKCFKSVTNDEQMQRLADELK